MAELVCHPGVGDAELAAAYGWDYAWDAETAALCDPRVVERVRGGCGEFLAGVEARQVLAPR